MGQQESVLVRKLSTDASDIDNPVNKSTVYDLHQYLEDPEDLDSFVSEDSPLILPEPSFRVELGGSTTAPGADDATKPVLEETQKHSLYYKENYFGKDHFNFVGGTEATPFVVSLLQDEKPKGSSSYIWKALVRTKSDDLHYEIFAPTRSEALKALQHEVTALQGVELFEVKNGDIAKELQHMEERLLIPAYKFGVVYCKEGQTHENDMFSNQTSSKEFTEFMELMGDKIKMKGWQKYRGGLDVLENTTGSHSYFTSYRNFDVMYHVSTMLPYSSQNMQQLERKRHIGNDVVVIVFQDGATGGFKPSTITSKFNHVYIVVQVVKDSDSAQSVRNAGKRRSDRPAMASSAPPTRKLVSSQTVELDARSSSATNSPSRHSRTKSGTENNNAAAAVLANSSSSSTRKRSNSKSSNMSSLRSEPSAKSPSMAESPSASPARKKRHMSQERPLSPETASKREHTRRAVSQLRVTSPDASGKSKKRSSDRQSETGSSSSSSKKRKDEGKGLSKSTPAKGESLSTSPAKKRSKTKYRIAVVSKQGVRPFGPVLPRDKIWGCNSEFREFLLTKLFNAERAAYYAPGFAQTRTRRLWLKDLLDKYGPAK